jgi:thiol-disulfide isomerase/thioredoxin
MKTSTLAAAALSAVAVFASASACKRSEAACDSVHSCLPSVAYEDLTKTVYSPQSLHGKVVVVNFWATWCAPCKKEIPAFNRVYSAYQDKGVVFLGVLHDERVDDNGLLNFMSDNEFTYPVVKANGKILDAYEYPNALPTTFIYDKHGKIITEHKGPMSEEQLMAHLDRALGRL